MPFLTAGPCCACANDIALATIYVVLSEKEDLKYLWREWD